MVHAVRMPRPGQMTEECTLLAWRKVEGESVARGDVLFEIETDKAVMEVEAFEEGTLLRRLVAEGATVPVNAICGYIGQPGEEVPNEAPMATTPVESARQAEPEAGPGPTPSPVAMGPVPVPSDGGRRGRMSPRAGRLAAELGVDPRTVVATGPDGRIVERDVRAAAAAIARPAGIVEEGERRPLPRMRRIIAARMSESASTAPQFSVTTAVDVTRLEGLRAELKAAGTSVTMTDFVMMASARSLVELPVVNSRTDGESVWLRRRVHLGLAVAVPDGLVVIVLRDADHLALTEIHDRAGSMADAARSGRLSPDDMQGSTFTISNLGMYGVEQFAAIINPGESAILAVGGAVRTPVVVGDGLAIRSIMRLTLSADHRLVDGELAARFLTAVRRRLEDPDDLMRTAIDL